MNKDQKLNFLGIFLFFSLIIAFFFSEDLLGGAQHDFAFHKKFVILFDYFLSYRKKKNAYH